MADRIRGCCVGDHDAITTALGSAGLTLFPPRVALVFYRLPITVTAAEAPPIAIAAMRSRQTRSLACSLAHRT